MAPSARVRCAQARSEHAGALTFPVHAAPRRRRCIIAAIRTDGAEPATRLLRQLGNPGRVVRLATAQLRRQGSRHCRDLPPKEACATHAASEAPSADRPEREGPCCRSRCGAVRFLASPQTLRCQAPSPSATASWDPGWQDPGPGGARWSGESLLPDAAATRTARTVRAVSIARFA